MAEVVAVDVGATWVRMAIVRGGVIEAIKRERNPGTEEGLERVLQGLAEGLGIDRGRVEKVGAASIGPLDLRRGYIVGSPNIKSHIVRLSTILKRLFPKSKVAIANDAVAAAWGEYLLGRLAGTPDLGYITMSTGVGGGFVVGGRLLLGSRGNAHEVGHIVVDMGWEGGRCGCGGTGHWEAIAGGRWIPRTSSVLARGWRGPETSLYRAALEGRVGSAREVFEAAAVGDDFALHVIDYIARASAAGIASVKAAYDVDAVIIGGSVYLNNRRMLRPLIERHLAAYAPFSSRIEVVDASFGDNEGVMGAYAIAYRNPEDLPIF
ncbi:ATP-dependent glucokinase [Aeropyrum pernix K1]|uniref:Glucokinase n=1 Tax=Aeropyrum pernix (strain ATCC 700893 / DSM 11879 / JCM 9820 / NBRC 100138 / K1) TaxID=272557 RepID=GLK_AERPE|nr:ATP-dependent glucokinase [Aeropyrum pernix]Q9YA47.2 RecName: Full=Glucokinase; AltName: Full=ATP-dependent glucokinase; Short=ATP-GLK; AltName: Full=Glucose kinase [Aeropyrum pernix K1]pir/JC7929/ ATP-dependent glucokinase (EC 2.7.1.2) - Aeropyrum pernix K1 [Aeropyrum pernix K1]BAA81102.2 ATP-dependent glucokinase [Aeropyrum pernix K1]